MSTPSLGHFRTDDPAALGAALEALIGADGVRFTAYPGFRAELRVARLPRVPLFNLRLVGARLEVAERRPFVAVTLPLSGRFVVREQGRDVTYRPGMGHVLPPAPLLDIHSGGARVNVLAFGVETELLAEHLGEMAAELETEACLPSGFGTARGAGASLLRAARFLWRELQREDALVHGAQVGRAAEEMLAAALADAWRSTHAEPAPPAEGTHDAFLRRAEAFVEVHLGEALSLAEIADAAGCSTKTLSRVFRDRRGTGPMAFARHRRLEAVRQDLQAAEPGPGAVTEVALRYGFAHLGRFAGEYRETFGELPSETLVS
jgi:AraC-like DNA-binding protein